MNPPRSESFVRMPDAEFEAILTRAAEEGAKRALADVGLDGDEAALDIRDLRSLVDCIRLVRGTAMQTAVRMITTGVMLALLAGIAIKLKIFGGSPYPPSRRVFSFPEDPHEHDVLRPLVQGAGGCLALVEFLTRRGRLPGTGKLLINEPALDKLQAFRDRLGKPLIVRSAYRSLEHTAPSAARRTPSTWRAPPSTSPWRTTTRLPLRRRRGRSGSSASGSIPAQGSSMSTSAPRGSGASGSRYGRPHLQPSRRPRGRCWPTAVR